MTHTKIVTQNEVDQLKEIYHEKMMLVYGPFAWRWDSPDPDDSKLRQAIRDGRELVEATEAYHSALDQLKKQETEILRLVQTGGEI